jgi:hypothetical protein
MNWEEACRVFGIAPTATEQEIQEQYRYKVQILHPDGNYNKPVSVRMRAEEELKLINEAYTVLKDLTNKPINSPPKLDISLRKIRFREIDLGQKKSITFEVKSVGGTYTKFWIDDSPAPWLRVREIKSLTGELLPVKVTIEATGIGKPEKRYTCSLAMRLESDETQSKDEAVVRVELRMKDEPGVLKVGVKKPIKFRFVRPGIMEESFDINNIGRGSLHGHLFTTRPWLSVTPDSFVIAPSRDNTFTIKLSTRNLSRGSSDKAFINIIADGGNERIPVELSMALFPLKTLYAVLLYFILGCLLLAPFLSIYLPGSHWGGTLFWIAAGIYLVLVSGFIYWLHPMKQKGLKK